jgi:phosphatidylglycerol:prolipoprotein diacylglycerol transferase
VFVWNPDPVLLHLGRLQIRYYGLCFLVGLLGGYFFWRWQVRRSGRPLDAAERLVTPAVIAVVAGARLGHVLFYELGYYLQKPLEILFVWRGGLASHGATVALLLVGIWYSRREKMPFLEVCDRFAFSAAWAAGWVRIGNFMNSEIVGRPTGADWGVKFPRYDFAMPLDAVPARHPSQLYEMLIAFAALGLLFLADRKLGGEKRPRGALIFLFLAVYFGGRFAVEFFKELQTPVESVLPLTMGQCLSLPFALAGIAGFVYVLRRRRR